MSISHADILQLLRDAQAERTELGAAYPSPQLEDRLQALGRAVPDGLDPDVVEHLRKIEKKLASLVKSR